jgi:DNA-binding HxlR family transcriptional regulator
MNHVSDLGVENVMKRKSLKSAEYPIARALDEIGDWWTLLIVGEAVQGVCRFSDFQRRIGIAKNILSVRLRRLVEDDILYVQRSSDRTQRGEYHLTVKGRQLQIILLALWQWGAENLYDEGEPMSLMVDMIDGKLLKPLELRAGDGRLLTSEEVRFARGGNHGCTSVGKESRGEFG